MKRKNIINGLLTIHKAKISRIFNKPLKPKVISYSVTWRCNAKCRMCGLSKVDDCLKDVCNELTANEIGKAFHDKTLDSLDLIRFTGGEPFLKNDLTAIVHQIWKNARPKLFYITTNGFFTDRIKDFVKFFSDKNINLSIQVSLDATNEIHDQIRGVPGLASRAMKTLETLVPLRNTEHLNIGINQTIIRENLTEIESVNRFAKKMGVEHKIYPAVNHHESKILCCEENISELNLASEYTKEERGLLYNSIKMALASDRNFKSFTNIHYIWHLVETYLLEEQKKRVFREKNPVSLPCLAGFLYFRLLPDGDVLPCTMRSAAMGNIKEKSFSEIWFSERAALIRKQTKECPGCWVECDIVPNFVYSHYILYYYLKNVWSRELKLF